VDLKIQLDEKKVTVSKIIDESFEMDDYWKIAKLFNILDNSDKNERKKHKTDY
jgi:hypothetical protein